jgi:uncharacterized membrane protein YebE (DUF533 family)
MPFDPSSVLSELGDDQLDAFVDTMVLAADADGELDDAEVAELGAAVASLVGGTARGDALSGDALGERIQATLSRIADGGRDALIAAVKARLPEEDARRAALGFAIAVTASDGIVRTSERELIMELAEALDVDRDVAADLVRDMTRG